MSSRILLVLSLALGAVSPAGADTYVVRPDGAGDFPTIQAAVDAAADGDEILLADGTYTGAGNHGIDLLGKAIVLRSQSRSASAVVLDCKGPGTVDYVGFHAKTGEGAGTRLEDLTVAHALFGVLCIGTSPVLERVTVRDGWSPAMLVNSHGAPLLRGCVLEGNLKANTFSDRGALSLRQGDAVVESCTIRDNVWSGIEVRDASPVIRDCTITGHYTVYGGGIRVWGASSPTIERCTLSGNQAISRGGGLYVSIGAGAVSTVTDCVIAGNEVLSAGLGGGLYLFGDGQVLVSGCTVTGNSAPTWGGGGYVDLTSPITLERCTITGNHAQIGGGLVRPGRPAPLALDRCILTGNCSTSSGPQMFVAYQAVVHFECSDVDVAGVHLYSEATVEYVDTIDTDPLFCLPEACAGAPTSGGVYTVAASSPVLSQPCGPMGALGSTCVISVEEMSWGRLKSMYRDGR